MAVNVNGGALEFDAVINDSQFGATIRKIEAQLQGLSVAAEKEASSINKLIQRTTVAIGGYASFIGSTNFAADIVRVRGEFQQLEVAFTTMLGSKERADKLLAEVTQFAATTPFELSEVAKATKQLLAFGIQSDDIIDTLRSLGDVSAGIGAPLGDIAYLFGTIKTQGKAMTQDVRQFAQRGIPIYSELAKVLGVAVENVDDFITAGKVGFPEIQKVFKNLTAEGSQFGGLMAEQAKTLTGQISNLRDAIDQMFNELGKSGEGVFGAIIRNATLLVENYEKVIDILKILVITYGSYRAAIIATNTVQAIAAAAAKGYTVIELLRYRALLLSERAMKLLNATILKNPAALAVAGIAALVTTLTLFGKKATEVKSKADLLAEANERVGNSFAEQEAKIRPYLEALKAGNVTEEERLNIYNKLKAIDPEIVAGLNAKTLAYESLKNKVEAYLGALRSQLKLEASKDAVTASIKKEIELQDRLDELIERRNAFNDQQLKQAEKNLKSTNAVIRNLGKEMKASLAKNADAESDEMKQLRKDIAAQKEISKSFGKDVVDTEGTKTAAIKRTVDVIEEEIKALKQQQSAQSTNAKQFQEFQKKINALEEEKKRIIGASKSETKSLQAVESKTNDLLERRNELLTEIRERQTEAANSLNATKQTTEIEKINDRYDALVKNISEYNKKVDEFNKKNPKSTVNKIGTVDLAALNAARKTEIDVVYQKEELERFKKSLEDKKALFEKYEEAKKQIGLDKANELFKQQTGGYESFLKVLNNEALQLLPKIQFGIATEAEIAKFKAITDQISEYNKKKAKEDLDQQIANFSELIAATVTYNDERTEINSRYDRLEAELNKNRNIKDFEERARLLREGREQELKALDLNLARQSALYKKLNEDILLFSRKMLRERINELKRQLKNDTSLTPQIKADIQATIEQYEGLLDSTNKVVKEFAEIGQSLSTVSGIFSDLASSLEGVNDNLSEVFQTLSDISNIASSAATAVASFAAGDILGGISGTVQTLAGLFSLGKRAKEERRQREKEIKDFLTAQFIGEQEINLLYQERAREQVRLNKLRLQGLADEKDLLLNQQSQLRSQFDLVLAELQKETARVVRTIDLGGLLGSQTFTGTESLFGKSFEELERLFLTGQLEGRAKDLFLELQKIKEAGVDVDRLLEENKRQAQELFTGTTAQSITDSIIEGFRNGERGINAFSGKFEDLMREALIKSLEFKALEGPLQDFFEQFASAAESEGALTSSEISQLQSLYNSIITNAQAQFDQLQQISGINLASGSGSQSNNLSGAIRGITEQQADLLAGQFGGLRITALEQLSIARQGLTVLNAIQVNTGTQVSKLIEVIGKFNAYEAGTKRLHVTM